MSQNGGCCSSSHLGDLVDLCLLRLENRRRWLSSVRCLLSNRLRFMTVGHSLGTAQPSARLFANKQNDHMCYLIFSSTIYGRKTIPSQRIAWTVALRKVYSIPKGNRRVGNSKCKLFVKTMMRSEVLCLGLLVIGLQMDQVAHCQETKCRLKPNHKWFLLRRPEQNAVNASCHDTSVM